MKDHRLYDMEFNLFMPSGAVRYYRNVEFCQWVERTVTISGDMYVPEECRGGIHCLEAISPMECAAMPGCYYDNGGNFRNGQSVYRYELAWTRNRVSSRLFHTLRSEFRNPDQEVLPEIEINSNVLLDNGLFTSTKHLGPALAKESMTFLPEHYQALQQSPAFRKGFGFMDEHYVIFDYSRFSSEHEFHKNIHRFTQFLATGDYDLGGPSLCTPGDIRVHYTVYYLKPETQFSIVASQIGKTVVPYHSKKEDAELYYVRLGDLSRKEVLDREFADIHWWKTFARIFLGIFVALTAFLTMKNY